MAVSNETLKPFFPETGEISPRHQGGRPSTKIWGGQGLAAISQGIS